MWGLWTLIKTHPEMGGGENREVARRFCGGKRMQGVGRKVGEGSC